MGRSGREIGIGLDGKPGQFEGGFAVEGIEADGLAQVEDGPLLVSSREDVLGPPELDQGSKARFLEEEDALPFRLL